MREFARDALRHFLLLDFRLPRTLARLLVPGKLTEAYLSGKRVRFVPPLRLFFITSFFLFLLLALSGGADPPPLTTETTVAEDLVFLAQQHRTTLTVAVFLLAPVFAGILKLLYAAGLYLEHAVFALHVHALGFIAACVVVLFGLAGASIDTLVAVFMTMLSGTGLYLLVAMRRVYRTSWRRTMWKWAALIAGYAAVVLIVVSTTVGFVLLRW